MAHIEHNLFPLKVWVKNEYFDQGKNESLF